MTLSFLNPAALFALLLIPVLLTLPLLGRRGVRSRQFWLTLALRAAVLVGLILGLAGAQLVQAVHTTSVVFVIDHSDSVPAPERARAEEFVRNALTAMNPGDRAGIVVFGENALVERVPSEDTALATVSSIPRTARTNLASALRLAFALLTDDMNKRIVILSDGLENAGRAEQLTDLAAARRIQVDYVSMHPPQGQAEVSVDGLTAPASVRQGQAFEVVANVASTSARDAVLRLFGDGTLLATRNVTLQNGTTRVAFALTADEAGFRRYTAEIAVGQDTLPQNNTAAAFTVVQGPPRVLVVEGTSGEGDNLARALASAKVVVERVAPNGLPGELAALAQYDAIFIVNVPATALPDSAMNNLPAYVRDLGRGLVMIGGSDAYGAGGYLRTPLEAALPVDMEVRAKSQEPNLAIAFVIDKSGSMGQCHCNNPNAAPGSYPMVASGLAKVDIAKNAVMQAARAVGRADYVGVVLFDADAHWAFPMEPMNEPGALQEKIGGARAEGGTNISAGLTEAVSAVSAVAAKFKHIVLLTDGWSNSGKYEELTAEMKKQNITLTVVAAGDGSAPYLEQLALGTNGRYFAARNMNDVPSLFFQETVRATGSYIIEELFRPLPGSTSPILKGLDLTRLPALRGYNGTTPKQTARVALFTERGDPLLATWQFGLGHAAAWTSDMKGQWADDWVTWQNFNTFVGQLTNWVLPQPNDAGIQAEFVSDGEQGALRVTAQDATGHPRDLVETQAQIVNPDGTTQSLTLNQTAPGVYSVPLQAAQPGVYLAQITQRDTNGNPIASATSGLVVPYSAEYKLLNAGASILPAFANTTSGRELDDSAQAFAPFAQPVSHAQPIWHYFLLAAALLFPLDVAARRLRLASSDWRRFRQWLHVPQSAKPTAGEPRALEGLFTARERVSGRVRAADTKSLSARQDILQPLSVPSPVATPSEEKPLEPSNPATETSDDGDMTTRLKRARERGRKARS